MPKVSDEYRAAKREEITRAAVRAFHRKGFHAASMADIIAEAGLSAGAIYGHFRSKAEIVLEVATHVVDARMFEVEELAETVPMPPPATLVRVLTTGMTRDVGSPSMLVQLWGEAVTEPALKSLASGVIVQLRSVYSSYIALWHQREHGLSADAARALAEDQVPLFMSAAQGFVLHTTLLPDFDQQAFLASVEKYLPR